jgi:O-antigen/teichoic acid export membrane protein
MRREVARGAFWMLAEVGGGEGLAFVVFLVLTRLLTPADYGVTSVAGALLVFAQIPIMRGLADGVVALDGLDDEAICAAFWVTLLIAVLLCSTVWVAAGGLAWIFGEPLLAPVLRWFSLCLITSALCTVPLAVLRRQLRFSAFALRAAVGGAVGGIVGISMALAGCGIWALVGNQVAQGLASAAIVWGTVGWRPRPTFNLRALRPLWRFSVHAVLGATIDTLATKIDLLILGLSFDATLVGYYYLVRRIFQTFVAATIYPAWAVSLPVLSKFVGDRTRFNTAYVSIVTTAQTFWQPVVLAFGILSASLVPMLFGAHWQGAAPVAEAASLVGVSWAAVTCANQALCAAGRADLYARLAFVQLLLMSLLFGIAGRFGIVAAGYALSLTLALIVPLQLWALRRATGLTPGAFLVPFARVLVAGAAMAAAILAAEAAAASMPAPVRVLPALAAGTLAYLGGLWLSARPTCLEILALARVAIARQSATAVGVAEGGTGRDRQSTFSTNQRIV